MRRFKDKVKDIEFDYEKWCTLFWNNYPSEPEYQIRSIELKYIITSMADRLKKLETLTKANEYEFTTEEKLVRKGK